MSGKVYPQSGNGLSESKPPILGRAVAGSQIQVNSFQTPQTLEVLQSPIRNACMFKADGLEFLEWLEVDQSLIRDGIVTWDL